MNKRLLDFLKLTVVFSLAPYLISSTAIKAEGNSGEIRITNQAGESVFLYKQSHALIIWVRDYQHWPSLEAVPQGGKLLEDALRRRGFNVIVERNPNSERLRDVVNNFIGKYGYDKRNRLVIFFAGHGWTIDETDGYIVPADAPDPITDERGFFHLAISMEDVMAWAKRIRANHTLFLFDSCFSGTLFQTKTLPDPNDAYIRTLTAKPVRQFLTAGDAGEEVPAGNDFVRLFIQGLNGDADVSGDGYVTGLEIGAFVQTKLPSLTGNTQSPQYGKLQSVKFRQGDIVFRSQTRLSSSSQPRPSSPTAISKSTFVYFHTVGSSEIIFKPISVKIDLVPVTSFQLSSSPVETSSDLLGEVGARLQESLEVNAALQSLYLSYSTATEALRIIDEAVQKGIDISENERQDISQGQE